MKVYVAMLTWFEEQYELVGVFSDRTAAWTAATRAHEGRDASYPEVWWCVLDTLEHGDDERMDV